MEKLLENGQVQMILRGVDLNAMEATEEIIFKIIVTVGIIFGIVAVRFIVKHFNSISYLMEKYFAVNRDKDWWKKNWDLALIIMGAIFTIGGFVYIMVNVEQKEALEVAHKLIVICSLPLGAAFILWMMDKLIPLVSEEEIKAHEVQREIIAKELRFKKIEEKAKKL